MIDVRKGVRRFRDHPLGSRVYEIVWTEWDPIGLGEELPDDEYDSYVWGLLRHLDDGADAFKIAAYLDRITCDTIGMPWPDAGAMNQRHNRIAEMLIALRT